MTIQAIIDILTDFSETVKGCKAQTENSYKKSLEQYRQSVKEQFMELRKQVPELVQINYDEELSDNDIKGIIEAIRRNNSKRDEMASLVDYYYHNIIQGTIFDTPSLYYLNAISYVGSSWQKYVYNILITAPIHKTHFTFIDLNMTGESNQLGLSKKLCTNIYNQEQLYQKIKELRGRVEEYLQKDRIPQSYEFIFVLSGSHLMNYFTSLFSKGKECRIYFLLSNDSGDEWPGCVKKAGFTKGSNDNTALIRFTPLVNYPQYCDAILMYANEEADKQKPKKEDEGKTLDILSLCKKKYNNLISSLSVPIGISEKSVHNFNQNTIEHVHTFIVGQSGTGKSTLLHNIILGASATCAPEDLILYLVDLKIGGVEFDRYRNMKHVRALLVDNSDIQITIEVLRDLQKLMIDRGKKLRNSGAVGIEDYNKKNSEDKMPQVLFIADECHEMFNARDNKNSALFREMSSIIEKIAKEGRSQGVHLVLATQTLADAEIPSSIINNITDYYLFKCSVADSEKLVRDSSKQTSNLKTGCMLYAGIQGREVINSYFITNDKMRDMLSAIEKKAKSHRDNRVLYFNGSQFFPIDKDEIKIITTKTKEKSYPLVSLGYNISLEHDAIRIPLTHKDAENILVMGINDEQQVTRTTLNATVSLLTSIKALKKGIPIYVMDFLGIGETPYANLYKQLEKEKQVTWVKNDQQSQILSQLADCIFNGEQQEAILIIIGQERFSALKLDKELEKCNAERSDSTAFETFSFKTPEFGNGRGTLKKPRTYKEAIELILSHGPVRGIHTILQIDTPEKLLFNEYISPKMIASLFNHLVMLRSRDNVAPKLGLDDGVRLERLSSNQERLRAYYYNLENNTYKLFTPYQETENSKLSR